MLRHVGVASARAQSSLQLCVTSTCLLWKYRQCRTARVSTDLPALKLMIVDMAHGNGLVELVARLGPQTTTGLAILVAYIALCRSLRYRRRDQKHAEYPYKTREDFKKMTAEHAWEITKYVQGLEFPWTSGKALAFALFK
jgi:hypothetical protein